MSNTFKTAMLLGVLSALLLLIGEALGGAQGLVLGFMFAALTCALVLVVAGPAFAADGVRVMPTPAARTIVMSSPRNVTMLAIPPAVVASSATNGPAGSLAFTLVGVTTRAVSYVTARMSIHHHTLGRPLRL